MRNSSHKSGRMMTTASRYHGSGKLVQWDGTVLEGQCAEVGAQGRGCLGADGRPDLLVGARAGERCGDPVQPGEPHGDRLRGMSGVPFMNSITRSSLIAR